MTKNLLNPRSILLSSKSVDSDMASGSLRGLGTAPGLTNCVVTTLFYLLAVIAVALRIWAKNISRREYRIDDWFAFAALVWASGFFCISLMSVYPGVVGMHVEDVMADPELGLNALFLTLKLYYAAAYVWITSTALTKLSILYLYVGIFKNRSFYIAAASIGSLLVVFWFGDIIVAITQCRPIAKNWNILLPGTCASSLNIQLGTATLNMIFDLAIVILPMPVLWKLQMAFRKKLLVTGVLSLGLCICAMNMARVILEATGDQQDFTFSLNYAGMFAGLEVFIGIIVSCMTTYGPIVTREKLSYATRQRNAYNSASSSSAQAKSRIHAGLDNSFNDEDGFERLGDDGTPLKESAKTQRILSYDHSANRKVWVTPGGSGRSTLHSNEMTPDGAIRVQNEVDVFTSGKSKKDWSVV